jgi:hypothetical protein
MLWDTGVTSFAFGNPGTFWVGYLADLHGNGVMEGNDGWAGGGFTPWGSGYTSFAFGPAHTPYAGDLVRLRSDGTLTANTQGGPGVVWDTGVASFAFGADGTLYTLGTDGSLVHWAGNVPTVLDSNVQSFSISSAGIVTDVRKDGTRWQLTPSGWVQIGDAGSPPVAAPDTYWRLYNDVVNISSSIGVLANDTDPQNLPLTAQLALPPSHGQVVLQPDGSFTYTPTPGYAGTDSFSYTASDGEFTSSPATVTIKVAVPPVAIDHTYTVPGGTASTITADQGVLLHDVDPQSLPLQAKLVAGPASGGSVTLQPDGSFTVTPAPGFAGKLTFTYQAYDSVASSTTASVTVTVIGPPVAYDVAYTLAAGETLHVPAPGLLGKDTDPSGLPLSVASHGAPGSGTLAINPDGSFDYTPAQGFSGLDSFTYVVTDGLMSSNTARVDITVIPAAPLVALDQAYTIGAGQALRVPAPGILGGDSDPSGLPLSIQAHGSPRFGFLALNSDGSFDYTPFASFSGTDSFSYTISDGTGLTASATISVTVQAQPQPQPQPPHVLEIVGSSHSRKGLTAIDVVFDEALDAISAQDGGYTLIMGVKKRRHVTFSKSVRIRSIEYDANAHMVAINLAKPAKGPVQVTVRKGIAAANGAISIADFSTIVS